MSKEKKSYYDMQLDALNSIEKLKDKKEYIKKIDFTQLIEKDSDAQTIADINKFTDFLNEGILKENIKEPEKLEEQIDLLFSLKKIGDVIHIIAEHLLNKYSFKTISGTKADKIYIYEEGIYKDNGKDIIRKECEELLKEKCSGYRTKEVINKIATKSLITREDLEKRDYNLICLNNGIFDLNKMELTPHTAEKIFLSKFPINYNPAAKCPNIEQFIKDTFYEEDIKTIWEWIGFQLYPRYFIKKAVIHVGERDTGKTTFLNLLNIFIGKENISNVSLQKITRSDFARKSLYKKYSNICDDLSAEDIQDVGSFKMATGGGVMGAEEKFGDEFGFVNFAKFTYACNRIPKIKDIDDDAYYSRFIIFRHDNLIIEKNNFLIDKITTQEELSGMLNFAIEELKNLLEIGDFSYNKSPGEVKAIMQRSGNPLVSFAQDCLNEQEGEWISKQDLFDSYIEFVTREKLPRMSKDKFSKNIIKYCRYLVDAKDNTGNHRGWKGVRIGSIKYEKPF